MNYVIAEVGLNHGGDLEVAKTLIEQAKKSGCWGVKFQYREVTTFYDKKNEVGDVMIYDEIKRNFLSTQELVSLSQFCKKISINFGLSFFRIDDFIELSSIKNWIDFYKIPSAECLNITLLKRLQKEKKKVFVSTGGHNSQEIINVLRDYKKDIILLHCISNYPTCLGTQDLRVIAYYKDNGFTEVGYSSHDEEWEVCLIAISHGANWIERHITMEKASNGLDHSSSSNFDEFKKLVRFSTDYEKILGQAIHKPNQGELINLQNLGTSLYAKRNILAGENTTIQDFDVRAPRVGITPAKFVSQYENVEISKGLKAGEALLPNNFFAHSNSVDENIKSFARQQKIGIPVRIHDYVVLKNQFDLANYEFHLSFTEVLSGNLDKVIVKINEEENISVHLPDYIPNNELLDPLSRDKEIKQKSRQIIQLVSDFAKKIEQRIFKKVPIIGSFSRCHNKNRTSNLNEVFDYISIIDENILPQWLPVYAWYFGGSVKLGIFNSCRDIDYIVSNNKKICLDLSHLVMSATYHNENWKDWFEDLIPVVEHMHISDASDATSEGLMFGDGQIGNFSDILKINKLKIIESWQGHMNEGEGFKKSLEILYKQFSNSENVND